MKYSLQQQPINDNSFTNNMNCSSINLVGNYNSNLIKSFE